MHRIRSLLEGSLQVEGKHLQGKSRDRWYTVCEYVKKKQVPGPTRQLASEDEYKKKLLFLSLSIVRNVGCYRA